MCLRTLGSMIDVLQRILKAGSPGRGIQQRLWCLSLSMDSYWVVRPLVTGIVNSASISGVGHVAFITSLCVVPLIFGD